MSATNPTWQEAAVLIKEAQHIVVLQAENPDGDSLGSALALEEMLGEMGKQVTLFCKVIVPTYLRYVPGWDRVVDQLPKNFDLAIFVDSSTQNLFSKTFATPRGNNLQHVPAIIFDHHAQVNVDDHLSERFEKCVTINEPNYVATSELLYEWAQATDTPVTLEACELMATSILADSLGLMSDATTARTFKIMAEFIEKGVKLPELDARRRELMKKSPEILAYKARLIERIEYHLEGQLALVQIPWNEITQFSHQYNPSVLVLDEMRLVTGVRIAAAVKTYPDGKLTMKLRANPGGDIAADLAAHFGSGGHPYAAGFKVYTQNPQEIIHEMLGVADKLLRAKDDK